MGANNTKTTRYHELPYWQISMFVASITVLHWVDCFVLLSRKPAIVRRRLAFRASTDNNGATDEFGQSLKAAGEYLSEAACCLPNWYSSKEGLTGESPAVFGGGGTALSQAGGSWSPTNVQGFVSDLLAAACALEPVDLGTSLEEAAMAIERAAPVGEEKRGNDNSSCVQYELEAAEAFEEAAVAFREYGEALEAEEHESNKEKETAGNLLGKAAVKLCSAARILRTHGLCDWTGAESYRVTPRRKQPRTKATNFKMQAATMDLQ